jgi:hypothetical protein
VLWRRIAGGLDEAAQGRVLDQVMPFLPPADPRRAKPRVAGVKPEAVDEMIRLAASLERVPPARKRAAGEDILERVAREGPAPHLLWAIGRLGARVPFYGSGHACVPPEVAEAWIERVAALPGRKADLAFPLAQLARATGGQAFTAPDEQRLREVYTRLGSRLGSRSERRELTDLFAGGAGVLALAAGGLSMIWFRRLP